MRNYMLIDVKSGIFVASIVCAVEFVPAIELTSPTEDSLHAWAPTSIPRDPLTKLLVTIAGRTIVAKTYVKMITKRPNRDRYFRDSR
jgi:hypothetical protein